MKGGSLCGTQWSQANSSQFTACEKSEEANLPREITKEKCILLHTNC